jgi:hypothetical protein
MVLKSAYETPANFNERALAAASEIGHRALGAVQAAGGTEPSIAGNIAVQMKFGSR